MHDVIRYYSKLLQQTAFFSFQHALTHDIYQGLSDGYAGNANEVKLVTRMVQVADGRRYDGIRLYAEKIHGSTSSVYFNCQGKSTSRELGDSVYITIITKGRQRLLQRVCIVQNKVAKQDSWAIDPAQLYLLKNFPPFSGKQGLFSGRQDVLFRDANKCLGMYGLFHFPGEMMCLSASLTAELLRGRHRFALTDISIPEQTARLKGNSSLYHFNPLMREEILYYLHRHGDLGLDFNSFYLPFLNYTTFMRDLHDLSRNWLLCNLGEYCYAFQPIDAELDRFAVSLLRRTPLADMIGFEQEGYFIDQAEVALFVAHIDIEGED